MSDNLIERLRDGLTLYALNNEAANALEAMQKEIEGLEGVVELAAERNQELIERIEELEAALPVDYWEQNCLLREKQERVEQLETAFRKIEEVLGEDFIVHELRCALDNSDPDGYPHPEDKRYCEEMRPHLEAVLKHFGGNE